MVGELAEESVMGLTMLGGFSGRGGLQALSARVVGVLAGAVLLLLVVCASSALADTVWRVEAVHGSATLAPNGTGTFVIEAYNVGSTDSSGDVTLVDTLPAGVTATAASGGSWVCPDLSGQVITCTNSDTVFAPQTGPGSDPSPRGAASPLSLDVSVGGSPPAQSDNQVTVSGGGAADPASVTDPTVFSSTPSGFGLSLFGADAFDAGIPGGTPVRQAGAHPFEARFDLNFNLQQTISPDFGTYTEPDEHVQTTVVETPRGFVGNPEAAPKCTPEGLSGLSCPASTQIGTANLVLNNINTFFPIDTTTDIPVYNLVPPKGSVADLAFAIPFVGFPIHVLASLDPANHYAIKTTINAAPELLPLRSAHVVLWGVPADPAHDALRFNSVPPASGPYFGTPAGVPAKPFLTLPSQCDTAGSSTVSVDSWQHPGAFKTYTSTPALATGCDDPRFRFEPSIKVQPTTTKPDTPTGLSVDITVPQKNDTVLDPNQAGQLYAPSGADLAIATPPLKQAVVQLPAGMTVSPSSADGLAACSSLQISLGTNTEPACPDASKIGTVQLVTPLLPDPVNGSVYLAAQNDNPFGTLLALYLVLEDKDRGLLLKLPGRVETNPNTGQLTTTFDDNPQVPFSSLHLQLKSGPRAPLTTPAVCGVQTTTAQLSSWNSSLPATNVSDSFTISKDGNGAPCDAQGFTPGLDAGTTNPVAGQDSPLVTTITRPDGDQDLGTVDLSLPQGLLGRVSSAVLCPEAAASAGSCTDGSKIGGVTVAAGEGSNPFYITDGRVYITGPYKGAPFGLAIVVHAKAGPLDLGNVVVRAQVQISRSTAAVRVVTDPLPTILAGIPLKVRLTSVVVDRPGFWFNPTGCMVKQITGKITSATGTAANVSTRFQALDCERLAFAPHMSITVGGKGHTAKGVSTPFSTTITMGKGGANLKSVSVTLPTTLNALLPVVNQACTLASFEAGTCTSKARVGSVVLVTPLLRDPLRGSVFFVKNPARAIPDLIVALRGQVDFDLVGKVAIPGGKALATHFDRVPDVPFTKFRLNLVSGTNGPLGTAANLCTRKSKAATAALGFRAQNGKLVKIHQRLHINGCTNK